MPVIPPGSGQLSGQIKSLKASIPDPNCTNQENNNTHLSSIIMLQWQNRVFFYKFTPQKLICPIKSHLWRCKDPRIPRHLPPILHHITSLTPGPSPAAAKLSCKPVGISNRWWWCEWSNGLGKNWFKTRSKLVWMKNRLVKLDHFPLIRGKKLVKIKKYWNHHLAVWFSCEWFWVTERVVPK